MESENARVDAPLRLQEGDDGVAYRTLPHNIEAEQALLGAMLINNEAANRVAGFSKPEHFFQPVHGRIYEAVLSLVERGQIATPVTLKTYFENDEALANAGIFRFHGVEN